MDLDIDIESLRDFDFDLPAIIDLQKTISELTGREDVFEKRIVEAIGPEKLIQVIGKDRLLQTIEPKKLIQIIGKNEILKALFPKSSPEQIRKIIELAEQSQSD